TLWVGLPTKTPGCSSISQRVSSPFKLAGGFFKIITSTEHLLNVRQNTIHDARLKKRRAAFLTHGLFQLGSFRSGQAKGDRDRDIGFVEISDIVNEAEQLARMNEADGRRVARRDNGSMAHTVKAGVGG